MRLAPLPEAESQRLSELFGTLIAESSWRRPLPGEAEPSYTRDVIMPTVADWLATLGRPQLFLRGDGVAPPRSVSLLDMFWYPDIEIVAFERRHLVGEVKFLRDVDASGSVSKAVGQAALYRAAGVDFGHVLLIDCRARPSAGLGESARDLGGRLGLFIHHIVPTP